MVRTESAMAVMSCLPFTWKRSECACGCGRYAETQMHTCRNGGGDTCARVPWFLLKCSSTAASGASRWHCTAVCGTGLCSADPLSVCLACPLEQLLCSLGNLDASFPSFANPFLLFLFSTAIFAYGQMALASISNR